MSKPVLGIIGGGQLGSMLANAAKKISVKTVIFCDDPDAPAQNFSDEFIYGKYDNQNSIDQFISSVDIITFEFENIPYKTLEKINSVKPVLPHPSINKIVQNRLSEKDFVNKLNIRTTQYTSINSEKDIFSNENLIPGLLKTCTLGYDGKGQHKINSIEDLKNKNIDFNKKYILEKLVKFKKEISVIITRFKNEKFEIYEPIENIHEDQILKYSKIPADINEKIYEESKKWARMIAEELKYVGTLCVEFFIDKSDNLYVNEIAPRVHNSGHLTINAYNISQFENHIRAVCNLERMKLNKISNAKMLNLIGEQITIYRKKEYSSNEFFFDYLKKEIKNKRKMGHLTTLIK